MQNAFERLLRTGNKIPQSLVDMIVIEIEIELKKMK